ncbi:MAG: hypothetical protein KGO96_10075 [Elusimicrobia bacterium]|nr:hypothetical protein [Elusimicrobiota bacterium]
MTHPAADVAKQNIAGAFGMPDHLRDALHAWIDSVEERLDGVKSVPAQVNRSVTEEHDRIDELEGKIQEFQDVDRDHDHDDDDSEDSGRVILEPENDGNSDTE